MNCYQSIHYFKFLTILTIPIKAFVQTVFQINNIKLYVLYLLISFLATYITYKTYLQIESNICK